MLFTEKDYVVEIKEQMRGGSGEVKITRTVPADALHSKCRLIAEITLEPGCSIGYHEHTNEMEIFTFVQGEGIANDDGVDVPIKKGDVIVTYNGGHAVNNTGKGPLVFTAVIILD